MTDNKESTDVFDRVWCELAEEGSCDGFGGAEYRRVKDEFEQEFIADFIRQRANIGPDNDPMTEHTASPTTLDHLLMILSEECHEVGQRASKAFRFGIDEIEPEQAFDNLSRLHHELNDLLAVVDLIGNETGIKFEPNGVSMIQKKKKVRKYLEYSAELGRLST